MSQNDKIDIRIEGHTADAGDKNRTRIDRTRARAP